MKIRAVLIVALVVASVLTAQAPPAQADLVGGQTCKTNFGNLQNTVTACGAYQITSVGLGTVNITYECTVTATGTVTWTRIDRCVLNRVPSGTIDSAPSGTWNLGPQGQATDTALLIPGGSFRVCYGGSAQYATFPFFLSTSGCTVVTV